MSDIDVHLRLEELKYYENVTTNLTSRFNDLVKKYEIITSQEPLKVPTASSTSTEISGELICAECLSERNLNSFKTTNKVPTLSEHSICKQCLSGCRDDYSSIWLLPRTEKLKVYENAIRKGGRLTEPEMTISFNDGPSSANDGANDDKKTFAEITKYKRDIKRKRMKYRTTKAPPLTHTEELRNLISLQMELWEQYCYEGKGSEENVVELRK